MKRFNFGVVALVLGLTLAITGSAFKPATTETIYWFESDATGDNVGSYLPEGPACEEVEGVICALGFTEEDLQSVSPTPVLSTAAQNTPLDYDDDQRLKIE